MLPELKLKFSFPGFGSIKLEGKYGSAENSFQEVVIEYIPIEPCKDKNGLLIRICRDGNCYMHELKPLPKEEAFEGIGLG